MNLNSTQPLMTTSNRSSLEFKEAKKKISEVDKQVTQFRHNVDFLKKSISEIHTLPLMFISKYELDTESWWVPSSEVNWIKAALFSPILIFYYSVCAPAVFVNLIKMHYAKQKLESALQTQKSTPDPRIAFGAMKELMERPEQLKKTFEQGLIAKEFMDFAVKHLKEYNELKALPLQEQDNSFACAFGADWRIELGPMREQFDNIQKQFYHTYVIQKTEELKQKALQAKPEQDEFSAKSEALAILKSKYKVEKTFYLLPDYKIYKALRINQALTV